MCHNCLWTLLRLWYMRENDVAADWLAFVDDVDHRWIEILVRYLIHPSHGV